MNMHACPRDFLLKVKPELAQAESAASRVQATPGRISVSPRATDEPGVVEIAVRLDLNAEATSL